MQTLAISNKRNPKSPIREVKVIRSWSDASGAALYLHHNGIYGYKDASPVRSEKEIKDMIHDPMQLRYALDWWENTGRAYSEKYWATYNEALERRYASRQVPGDTDSSRLDTVQYQRRPSSDRREAAYSPPMTWGEMGFENRPEWWGDAKTIDLTGHYYRRYEAAETTLDPEKAAMAAAEQAAA